MITYHWSAVICLLLGHSAQKISSTDTTILGTDRQHVVCGVVQRTSDCVSFHTIRERLAVGNALLVMRARELRLSGST